MEAIIFRGKRIHDEEWIEGNLIIDQRGEKHIVPFDVVEQDGHHLRIDSDLPTFFHQDTFGQFTGKKDKKSELIFKGDIIYNDDRKCHCVVDWDEERAMWITDYGNNETYPLWGSLSNLYYKVGNIHDNPDLIK